VRVLGSAVARDPVDLLDRYEDLVGAREAQLEVVAVLAFGLVAAPEHLFVAGNAVVDVDDEVARRQPLEDVARNDPSEGLRPPDPDRPEQLAVRDEDEAVRATLEPAVEAPLDQGHAARRWRLRGVDDGRRMAGLIEQLRETRRLVGGEDDPQPLLLPAGDRTADCRRTARGQNRLAPTEYVARAQPASGERDRLRRLRLPRQLERPARDEPRLPRPRPDVGRWPVRRQVAAVDQLGPALVGLAPEEVGRLGDVAGFVDDEQRVLRHMVQPGRRCEEGCPHLRGVADVQRAGCGRRGRRPPDRAGRTRSGSLEPLEVGGQALRQLRGAATERLAERGRSPVRLEELRRGQQRGLVERADRSLVGRVERAQGVDLVAEELDPDRQRRGRREDVDDAAASRELAAAGDLEHGRVAEVQQHGEQRILAKACADLQRAWIRGQVIRRDRVLDQRLDAGDEDAGAAAPPGTEGRDPGGSLVGDQLAPLICQRGPRLQDRHHGRVAQPRTQLLRHPVADLRVAGDPRESLAVLRDGDRRRQVGLCAVRNRRQPDVPTRRCQPLPERGERAGRSQQRGQ
jgi:hypothetical protein